MKVQLGRRTEETVRVYFEKTQCPKIRAMLPQNAQSVEEALRDFEKTLLSGAASYGRTILVDGVYIGDIWCYAIDPQEEPNAMLSYCIWDDAFWSKGIATKVVSLFLSEVKKKYLLRTIGAFTFSDNFASIRVLEKNGFLSLEEFVEEGRESKFFQRSL